MRLFSLLFAAILALSGVSQSLAAEKVQLPDDLGTAMLYKAKRSDAPAVVVVHEWWGLNDYARKRAKMLAEAGYRYFDEKLQSHGGVEDIHFINNIK